MRNRPVIRLLTAAVVVLLGAALISPAPASADPGYLPSPQSGAVVTHLDLTGRTGFVYVVLTAGVGDEIVGVTVTIPAAGGTWHAASSKSFAAPGLTCTGGTGADLVYTCLTASDPDQENPTVVPEGSYVLALPVVRPRGPVDGMAGTTDIVRAGVFGAPNWSEHADSFPVLNAPTDAQSTAEVRELDLYGTGLGSMATGMLSLHVQIPSGERVTGVYVALPLTPGYGWTVQYVTFPSGISCNEDADYPPTTTAYVLSCHDYAAPNLVWPAGQYQLNLHIGSIGDDAGGLGTVRIRHLGGSPVQVDDFPAETPIVL